MAIPTLTTRLRIHDSTPVGSDFVGAPEPLPVRPAEPGPVVAGTDFAGGAVPLTAAAEHDRSDEEPAA